MVNDNQNDLIMMDINNKRYKQVWAGTHIVTTQECSLALIAFRLLQIYDDAVKYR